MKKLIQSSFLVFFLFLGLQLQAADDCLPKAPKPARLVNDYANVLDQTTEQALERALVNFNDTTSTQILILTVDDLCGYDAGMFAFEIGESWGVGNAEFNNGIVVLVRPKREGQKGHAFIATGYGLEGVLPDAISKRIVEFEMIPEFKKNNYDQGVINAAKVIMEITGGEYSAENYNGRGGSKKGSGIPVIFILFFIFIMFFGIFSRARKYANRNDMSLWAALWLMGSMSGNHRGRYNDFTSGRGGFGGFGGGGGGGFGGFGGGSFGGGGAGGSW